MYAKAGDAVAESLVVRLSSCKRATVRTIYGEQVPDLTMSEGSSIVDEKGSAEPWCGSCENNKQQYWCTTVRCDSKQEEHSMTSSGRTMCSP